MAEVDLRQVHRDILALQKDLSVIKYILFEEGELTEEAKKRLAEARKTPDSEYISLD
jgi:hypothetical protein